MNKYVLLMTMVLFLGLITLLVGSIDESVSSNIFSVSVSEEAPNFLQILSSVWNYIALFFRIMFFQVEGIPMIFNLIVFYPLTAGTIYMVVDIIRGNG